MRHSESDLTRPCARGRRGVIEGFEDSRSWEGTLEEEMLWKFPDRGRAFLKRCCRKDSRSWEGILEEEML
jgi:hypothetical protein